MNIVYNSFQGRYSDNPRALYERNLALGVDDDHVWFCDPEHAAGFPRGVRTVSLSGPDTRAALESADLVIANTHIQLEWVKKPGAVYFQTWHGTPLKRIHNDVLFAPPGVIAALDLDVARWDYLLSPNEVSTPRMRDAFAFTGEMVEAGSPRNDVLSSPAASAVRAQVRAALGIAEDITAVLYTPTWRDDVYYEDGLPTVELALELDRFVTELGPGYCLLPRLHYMITDRGAPVDREGVIDVSRYPDVHELYLAADIMITDYSSTMFDFAVTGKPLIFFVYDLESYRDSVRGFYFDLEPLAPGPLLRTSDEVIAAVRDAGRAREHFRERYAAFREIFTHLDDGAAGQRLDWLREPARRQPQVSGQA